MKSGGISLVDEEDWVFEFSLCSACRRWSNMDIEVGVKQAGATLSNIVGSGEQARGLVLKLAFLVHCIEDT
ncbi:unnamed protein product [Protopolystoma xenopodis]|uniref:Uncharacterized protein n=1 Tax=Protopolystoma xenopodis TaxID=117903 RepID=A0A3S5A007_9PLAT|nr:unnamed protein product [Protopolystoma xenopodis]